MLTNKVGDTEAISKLQEALDMEPKKHKALFHLGNAYVTDGFQTLDDPTVALAYLDKATQCYGMAVDEVIPFFLSPHFKFQCFFQLSLGYMYLQRFLTRTLLIIFSL